MTPFWLLPKRRVAGAHYLDLLGLELATDHGWIVTLTGDGRHTSRPSLASGGDSSTSYRMPGEAESPLGP